MAQRFFYAACSLIAFALVVTGCQSTQGTQKNDEATVKETQSEKSEQTSKPNSASQNPADDVADLQNCSSARRVGILVFQWESVTGSKDAPDHGEVIESLKEDVDDLVQANSDESPCTGAVELAKFNYELAELRFLELNGASSSEDYQDVAEAGNEWIAAIEPDREYSFDAEYSG